MSPWKNFTFAGVAVLLSSAFVPAAEHSFPVLQAASQSASQGNKPAIVSYVLKDLEDLESQAISQTNTLRSQPWDSASFDSEWTHVKALWAQAAREASNFVPEEDNQSNLQISPVGTLVSTKLQPLQYEYVNRQDLTTAMHAHHKSIFLAEQPAAGSAAQCDPEANFADSPEEWAKIVALRQQSIRHLAKVSQHVSFYPEVVVPLQSHYQEKLNFAAQFYAHSPWYYAIQKAVCATKWGEIAKNSNSQEAWANAADLWQEGIQLLEKAPDNIPEGIPAETRSNYKTAQNNLELWRSNFYHAKSQTKS